MSSWTLPATLIAALASVAVFGLLGPLRLPSAGAAEAGAAPLSFAGPGPLLADPSSPADDDPAVLARLGSPASPEEDLGAAVDALAGASDAAGAEAARRRALDVLEGAPVAGRAYSGIPLLNWNAPAKVRTVPAGGNVTVTEVRFGERFVTDTSLLDFADASQPFTITYRIAELGARTFGGVFAPATLLDGGSPSTGAGSGAVSGVSPLVLPNLATGTTEVNRFHPDGGPEQTRLAVQETTVAMPAPRLVRAVLSPGFGRDLQPLRALTPATPARLAALGAAFGFTGSTPTAAEKDTAISRIGAAAPQKLLWNDLRGLDPASPGFLAAARALGAQDHPLLAAMAERFAIPPGVVTDPAADLAVVLLNDEAYVSRGRLLATGSRPVTVSVTNADGFPHGFSAVGLDGRKATFGALDWGSFDWRSLAAPLALGPGESRTLTLAPADGTFSLWLGDPDGGDQASATVALDRGPAVDTFSFGPRSAVPGSFAMPAHQAEDAGGDVWVALEGTDTLSRLTPAAALGQAARQDFLLPGGTTDITGPKLAPHDVAVDARGAVWTTLMEGNAIARLDPTRARPGTSDGIRVYPLPACDLPLPLCMPAFPPPAVPHPAPSRAPNQMKVMADADGNTVVWFSESNADSIGVLRVAPDGTLLDQADISCGCGEPSGLGLGADGAVWFTEGTSNAIGRLVPDQTHPYRAQGARLEHFGIPSGIDIVPPPHPGIPPALTPPFHSSMPHSLALDGEGRVWFTEEETAKLGVLDPTLIHPGAPTPITEFDLGTTDFGAPVQPADLAVDRANRIYFVDEYGDLVGSATAAGLGPRWRPVERASLTDGPMVTHDGNLWITEAGAGLVTRYQGLTAGGLLPAPPPVLTADLTTGLVSARALRDVSAVDVTVVRGSETVARAIGVNAAGGAFVAPVDRIAAGDRVVVTLHGPFPRAPLSFTVAALYAATGADGVVAGRALSGDRPLAGSVQVGTVGASGTAAVDPDDGGFRLDPASATPSTIGSDGNTVSWAGATVAAVFRTVAAVTIPPVSAPPGDDPVAPTPVAPTPVAPVPPSTASPETVVSPPGGGAGGPAASVPVAVQGTTEERPAAPPRDPEPMVPPLSTVPAPLGEDGLAVEPTAPLARPERAAGGATPIGGGGWRPPVLLSTLALEGLMVAAIAVAIKVLRRRTRRNPQ